MDLNFNSTQPILGEGTLFLSNTTSHMNHSGITNDGFDLALAGSLTDAGPLDARIEFTKPVQ
jgi:hypothetical protein